jgi:putative spermidine/putrescine transport system ATP-binding protein
VISAAGEKGLDAEVVAAVFLGNHWLYKLSSPLGELLAEAPNIGGSHWQAGSTVSIEWPEGALRALREENGHG